MLKTLQHFAFFNFDARAWRRLLGGQKNRRSPSGDGSGPPFGRVTFSQLCMRKNSYKKRYACLASAK